MTPREIELVRSSFQRAARLGEAAAKLFYNELFLIEPSLRPMFRPDMTSQYRKLMGALTSIVNALDSPEVLLDSARKLAIQHVAHGVQPQHYTLVGNALLRTLRKALGSDFTPEMRAAWIKAYQLLADEMRLAAYGRDTPQLHGLF